jgi:hypothetical protein
MNENIKWVAAAVAVVGLSIGGILYLSYFSKGDQAAPAAKPAVAVPAHPQPEEPAVKHPLPASGNQEALPPLNESDVPMQGSLADLIGKESVEQLIVPNDLIRHIVVTIDNLPEQKVAERLRPIKPAPGKFAVSGPEEAPVLNPANYERYKPMVQLILSTETQHLVATYTRYYPLFQEAYESLGHPPQYFNDRVIEVIDHLLATPELSGPIALAQPNVQYEFADSNLESRSAGQKVLLRMGKDNAAAVKAKLRELRSELVAQKPGK